MSPRRPPAQSRDRGGARRGAATGRVTAQPRRPSGGSARRTAGLGGEQVEGRRAVRELLAGPLARAVDVWLAEDLEESAGAQEIADLAVRRRVPVRWVPRARLEAEARTDAPQGVLAHARALPPRDLDQVSRGRDGTPPFLVVLDGITDPRNLGAILRSAVCAGATGAVLARHRAAHVTPAATKAAAGAIEHLPLALVPGIPTALEELSHRGVWTVGLDPAGTTSLFDLAVADQPVALVLGAEGSGLGRLAARRCDVVAAIPVAGPLASLNVGAAAAVACYAVARARTGAPGPR